MYQRTEKPSWSIRAAKLFSPDSEMVLIRFAPDFQAVEVVHADNCRTRDLLEAAQMALANCLASVK